LVGREFKGLADGLLLKLSARRIEASLLRGSTRSDKTPRCEIPHSAVPPYSNGHGLERNPGSRGWSSKKITSGREGSPSVSEVIKGTTPGRKGTMPQPNTFRWVSLFRTSTRRSIPSSRRVVRPLSSISPCKAGGIAVGALTSKPDRTVPQADSAPLVSRIRVVLAVRLTAITSHGRRRRDRFLVTSLGLPPRALLPIDYI
jgi:hypothetical protein